MSTFMQVTCYYHICQVQFIVCTWEQAAAFIIYNLKADKDQQDPGNNRFKDYFLNRKQAILAKASQAAAARQATSLHIHNNNRWANSARDIQKICFKESASISHDYHSIFSGHGVQVMAHYYP